VLSRAQARLISAGWVTSRVLAAPQDLVSGTLTLTLVPGRIANIRLSADSVLPTALAGGNAMLAAAIPARAGDLLNLHDIEQGLENFKRVPTADADIQIEPAAGSDARPGDSDLVVKYRQKFPLRAAISLDDSGTKSTGRDQTGLTVSADNLLGLNELFYVSANHSINSHLFSDPSHGTEGQTGHFSVPWGYWLLSVTASHSRYRQTVAGANQSYLYSGESDTQELKLSRLVYRDQRRKLTGSIKAFHRAGRNFIEDTEVEPQHRSVGGWEAGFNHREFIGAATLDGSVSYKRGTGAFGAIPAPEEAFGEGSSRMSLIGAEVNLNAPFSVDVGGASQRLRYAALVRGQWHRRRLTQQDQFAIGGRYTVRGFDGETSLLGDSGFLLRNDLGWTLESLAAEAYVGLDYGHVGGPGSAAMLGKRLAGAVIGLRGNWRNVSYDVFVGGPVAKPDGYRTAHVSSGFNLNLSF
jgi:hemolysin activation/secretion protein